MIVLGDVRVFFSKPPVCTEYRPCGCLHDDLKDAQVTHFADTAQKLKIDTGGRSILKLKIWGDWLDSLGSGFVLKIYFRDASEKLIATIEGS